MIVYTRKQIKIEKKHVLNKILAINKMDKSCSRSLLKESNKSRIQQKFHHHHHHHDHHTLLLYIFWFVSLRISLMSLVIYTLNFKTMEYKIFREYLRPRPIYVYAIFVQANFLLKKKTHKKVM